MHDVEREEIERLARLHGVTAVLQVLEEVEKAEEERRPRRPAPTRTLAPAPNARRRQADVLSFEQPTGVLSCSFCKKRRDQVLNLIEGPGAYICEECVALCQEILDREWFDLPEEENPN